VPYTSHRFAELAHVFRPDATKPADILASFQRFYFDTALSSSPAALPSLKAFAGAYRVLFGVDFSFGPADVAAYFTAQLDSYDGRRAEGDQPWRCADPVSASRPQHDLTIPERLGVRSRR
jgi:hypothetical protein